MRQRNLATTTAKICKGLFRNIERQKVFKPHSHLPYGADGSGYYSDHIAGVYNTMRLVEPLVLKAALSIPVQPGGVFTIADYGCADGGTSMSLWYECIKALREKHGDEKAIQIVYEDQPVNDFKSLFMRLQGLIPGPPSYYLDFPNVFASTCGTNFFSQCFPAGSVDFAFSSFAFHWLRELPCNITGALHHTMITDEREKEIFSEQAAKDWETILLHRAAELKSGSKMVLVHFAVDEEGQYLGNTNNIKCNMHRLFRDLWLGLVEDGTITEEEFTNTNVANYYRTIEELRKPFENPDSVVRKAGLDLVSIEVKHTSCPYHEKWVQERGSASAHAQWYVPTLRSWSNSTFRSGLSNSRTDEEKDKIVDEFYRRYEADVAQNPDDHAMEYVNYFIVIQKL